MLCSDAHSGCRELAAETGGIPGASGTLLQLLLDAPAWSHDPHLLTDSYSSMNFHHLLFSDLINLGCQSVMFEMILQTHIENMKVH